MNYIKAVCQSFKINKKTILLFWGVVLGGSVFGLILDLVVSYFTGEEIWGMGIMFSGMFFGISALFGSVFSGYSDFALAVYNGRARKAYVFSKYIYLVCEYAVSVVILSATYLFEEAQATVPENFIGYFSHASFIIFSIIFVLPVVVLLMSALYAKFDKKFFWVMWAVWMIVMTGAPRMVSAMEDNPESTVAKIGFAIKNAVKIGTIESVIGIVAITVIVAVVTVAFYSNVDVKE